MDDEKMLSDTEDVVALRSMMRGCDTIVDEIQRLRETATAHDRAAKLAALQKEFDRRIDELRTYIRLLDVPVAEEERKS
jgi:hypothetical protein